MVNSGNSSDDNTKSGSKPGTSLPTPHNTPDTNKRPCPRSEYLVVKSVLKLSPGESAEHIWIYSSCLIRPMYGVCVWLVYLGLTHGVLHGAEGLILLIISEGPCLGLAWYRSGLDIDPFCRPLDLEAG